MKPLGIILVHGYTGSPDDMSDLARGLGRRFGSDAVHRLCLPGHGEGVVPSFKSDQFETAIAEAVHRQHALGRTTVLMGHSTGGCLALGCLRHLKILPDALILAATPPVVRGDHLAHWEQHRHGRQSVPLVDVAHMVSYINRSGRTEWDQSFPVLVLSGAEDTLVPPALAAHWSHTRFKGPVRNITLPGAGHHLFEGVGGPIGIDWVARSISDLLGAALGGEDPPELAAARELCPIESGVADYLGTDASRARHLIRSPAALRVSGKAPVYGSRIDTDPIQLNIEITSRCNLECSHCARTQIIRPGMDMAASTFDYLLDLLPNTYRIVLVGLGEPTLHPQAAEFVAKATDRGHSVGMVTNAMVLDRHLSRQLIKAGLRAITFSLDCVDSALASQVRGGSNVERIQDNIKAFLGLAEGRVSPAVFSAVSARTVEHLPELADVVSRLGVSAWMLSDLNFHANLGSGLWKTWVKGYGDRVGRALKTAFSNGLPVLSVRGLEALGLKACYHDFLLTSPAGLALRSGTHQWCQSPWQTLPVDVQGYVSVCDCRPHAIVGNLLEDALDDIWNGREMQAYRRKMRAEIPPEDCRICPRF